MDTTSHVEPSPPTLFESPHDILPSPADVSFDAALRGLSSPGLLPYRAAAPIDGPAWIHESPENSASSDNEARHAAHWKGPGNDDSAQVATAEFPIAELRAPMVADAPRTEPAPQYLPAPPASSSWSTAAFHALFFIRPPDQVFLG